MWERTKSHPKGVSKIGLPPTSDSPIFDQDFSFTDLPSLAENRFTESLVNLEQNFYPNKIESSLLECRSFQRLHEINQQEASMVRILRTPHTRLEHSLYTGRLAEYICDKFQKENDQFSDHYKKVIVVAAILHDIGHGPFAHTTDYALSINFPYDKSINDHDAYGQYVIQNDPEILAVLKKLDIDHEDVLAVLEDDRKYSNASHKKWEFGYYLVKEVADRCAYIAQDFLNSNFSSSNIYKAIADSHDLIDSLTLVEENGNFKIAFQDLEAFKDVMNHRMRLFKNCSFHPYANLARNILIKSTSLALRNEQMDPKELRVLNDLSFLERLDRIHGSNLRDIMNQGVDQHYDVTLAFTLNRIVDGNSNYFQLRDEHFLTEFQRDLREIEKKFNFERGTIEATSTADYSKTGDDSINVPSLENGKVINRNMEFRVNRQDRFVTVFMNKSIGFIPTFKLVSTIKNQLLAPRIKPNTDYSKTALSIIDMAIDNDLLR